MEILIFVVIVISLFLMSVLYSFFSLLFSIAIRIFFVHTNTHTCTTTTVFQSHLYNTRGIRTVINHTTTHLDIHIHRQYNTYISLDFSIYLFIYLSLDIYTYLYILYLSASLSIQHTLIAIDDIIFRIV